jgi:hypothetical protein
LLARKAGLKRVRLGFSSLLANLKGSTGCGRWHSVDGEQRYGERKAIVDAEEREGPAYQTCRNAASICRAFPLESSRRRELLTFNHHVEVASLPSDEADALLDWCEAREGWRG